MMTKSSGSLHCTRGMLLFFCGILALLLAAPDSARAAREFKKKECVDCHGDFSKKYLGMKYQHPGVKNGGCQDCHLSHGIVGKLLLVEEGSKLCFRCHKQEDFKLDQKTGVHTALRRGKCSSCHNPHAADSANLLAAEGPRCVSPAMIRAVI